MEGCFLRGKLPLFLLFVFYTVIPGSGSTTGDYKVLDLMLGQKKTDYKVIWLVCYSAACESGDSGLFESQAASFFFLSLG